MRLVLCQETQMRKHLESKTYGQYINRIIDRPLLFNSILWIGVILLLSGLTSLNGSWPFGFYLLNMLVALPAMMIFGYSMDAIGQNFLFATRKLGLFFILLTLFTIGCSLLISLSNHYLFFGLLYPRVFEPNPWFRWRLIPQNFILIWIPYFMISIKTFFVNWFKAEQEKLIIENKQLLSEIQLMKIKLHPHFLFNTLNNLYAMSKRNSSSTSEYILKLSNLFRIMLYECNKDFYPLREELMLIQNYIELEKIRYDERLKLEFSLPENLDEKLMIPPLLFFTFVENAFKHGCRNDVGQPFIQIRIELDEDNILFRSLNSIPVMSKPNEFGGIGLENTHKRLELIFKDEYVFENVAEENCYRVNLKIPKLYLS